MNDFGKHPDADWNVSRSDKRRSIDQTGNTTREIANQIDAKITELEGLLQQSDITREDLLGMFEMGLRELRELRRKL